MSDAAIQAIRSGQPVILPTDTVYGLCCDGYRESSALKLFELKRRPKSFPLALLAADLDVLVDAIPELRGRGAVAARAIFPGPYTLVLPNPARRFSWLGGYVLKTIGIRVPDLPSEAYSVVRRSGVLAATSANIHGEPDPASLDDVRASLRDRVGVAVDGGVLPGVPSTVVELTAGGPEVIREGAGNAEKALRKIDAALSAISLNTR